MRTTTTDTTTEGFDLDAIAAAGASVEAGAAAAEAGDVIYELGGGVTIVPPSSPSPPCPPDHYNDGQEDPLAKSEEFKQKGNECFKQGNYLDAIDYYTDAIEACPGIKGEEILLLQQQHEEKEREKSNERYRRDTERKMSHLNIDRNRGSRSRSSSSSAGGNVNANANTNDSIHDGAKIDSNDDDDDDNNNNNNKQQELDKDDLAPKEFQPPIHPHGKQLAIYYSNKAASLMHLDDYSEALKCCNIAILVDSTYSKAYVRRMTCYEQRQEMELALADAKKALELNPKNVEIRKHVARLEKLEAERMEKLKTETMEKLKDIGNSILGNFGMSLDNFKAEKDPTTGSYSIKMV